MTNYPNSLPDPTSWATHQDAANEIVAVASQVPSWGTPWFVGTTPAANTWMHFSPTVAQFSSTGNYSSTAANSRGCMGTSLYVLDRSVTFDAVAVEVTGAASDWTSAFLNLGYYAMDSNRRFTTAPVTFGSIDIKTTGVKILTLGSPVTIGAPGGLMVAGLYGSVGTGTANPTFTYLPPAVGGGMGWRTSVSGPAPHNSAATGVFLGGSGGDLSTLPSSLQYSVGNQLSVIGPYILVSVRVTAVSR